MFRCVVLGLEQPGLAFASPEVHFGIAVTEGRFLIQMLQVCLQRLGFLPRPTRNTILAKRGVCYRDTVQFFRDKLTLT